MNNDERDWVRFGLNFMRLRDFEEAIRCFDQSLNINPNSIDALNNKGKALAELYRFREAIECFNKIIKKNPYFSEAIENKAAVIHNWGHSFANRGNHKAAIKFYNEALELHPDLIEGYYNLGNSLIKVKDYDLAIKKFEKAIELNNKISRYWVGIGMAFKNLERYDKAINCYDEAIRLDGQNHYAWINKGIVFQSLEKYEKALLYFDKVIELNPELEGGFLCKANVLSTQGEYEGAIKFFDKALKINPDSSEALVNKGISLGKLDKFDEAIQVYDIALDKNPNLVEAIINKGGSLGFLGDFENALIYYNKAINIEPNNAKSWYNKGTVLEKLNKKNEALKCYEKAISLDPQFPESWYRKGIIYGKRGNREVEINCYNQVLKINPDHSKALALKGTALGTLRKLKEANEFCKKSLEIDGNNYMLWDYRGYILLMLNELDEAINCFSEALKVNPNYPEAFNHKGIAYYSLKRYKIAIKYFNYALEINPELEDALSNKGMAFLKIGKNEESLEFCEKAVLIKANSIKALHTKGIALSNLGKQKEAIDCYNIILEFNPENFGVLLNKGNIFAEMGNFKEALECYMEVLKINPNFGMVYGNLGATYMSLHEYDKAIDNFRKAKELFQIYNLKHEILRIEEYEIWAINAINLINKLKPLDKKFLEIINSQSIKDLQEKSIGILNEFSLVLEEFQEQPLPLDAIELLKSKKVFFNSLNKALNFEDVDFDEIHKAKTVFLKWNFQNFIISANSLDNFCRIMKNYNSAGEIPDEEVKMLLNYLRNFQYLDGVLTEELSNKIVGKKSIYKPDIIKKEIKVDFVSFGEFNKKAHIRICLVQLDFELTKKFPYKLINKDFVKEKIFSALEIAREHDVDIICFPELSFEAEFLDYIKNFINIIIICGTFYDKNNFNTCYVFYNGNAYKVNKINPSPYLEDFIAPNIGMSCGNEIKIFVTENDNLRFTILICMDFYHERSRIFDYEYKGKSSIDFIFVPSFNDNKVTFQKCADANCYIFATDIIKVSNSNSKSITCIFGRAHNKLLERLKIENYRKADEFKFKLCEANGEMMMIVDIDRSPVEVPTPITMTPRIIIFKRFYFDKKNWVEST